MSNTPLRKLAPLKIGLTHRSLRKRLAEAFWTWFGEEVAFIDTNDPRFEGEPLFWAHNWEGQGSTMRIGQWKVELNYYVPFAPSDRDPIPAWAQSQHA